MTYNVLDIRFGTTVDGPGLRTAVYLAGCSHQCPGCHNPESWNPQGGTPTPLEDLLRIIKEEDFDVTLTGGDPLFNPESTATLVREIAALGKKVWIYTGYTAEQIVADLRLREAVRYADTIVEGPFIEALRDRDLLFRGSSNQRIIPVSELGI